jgi:hypothetical protein
MKAIYLLIPILLSANCGISQPISKIDFQADACFGPCPIFTMTIFADGSALYDAKEYNEQMGQFKTSIKKPDLDSLFTLVANVNIFTLKDKYSMLATDHPTYTLTVKLKDGKNKTIVDYGPSGPEQLKKIYHLLFLFRETQDWK